MMSTSAPRVCKRLTEGWRFHRGDTAEAWQEDFDHSAWRSVTVPHDWSIEDLPLDEPTEGERSGPFDSSAIGGGAVGYTVGGIGWYRQSFILDPASQGKSVNILFDGVYMNSEVWLNGVRLGEHPYGYTAFSFDLTPYLRYDGPNVLAVKVDSSGKTSRWYCGSGIYRHVWLTITEPVHVAQWGVFVSTPEVSAQQATVRVETKVCNDSAEAAKCVLTSRIVNAVGDTIAVVDSELELLAGVAEVFHQETPVADPVVWSPDSPAMYALISRIAVDGQVVDEVVTAFGMRDIAMSAETGLLLNGEPLELRGGCVHHDNGPLGACTYDRAEERRVELLKAHGFNAIRTAHNPPSPAFLEACDRLGMLVIDEAFDCWQKRKNPQDYHRFFNEWWQRDVAAMVLRDRNHPCVLAWSIGNEVVEQETGDEHGARLADMLSSYIRALDPTRAVAIGAHPSTNPWEKLDPLFAHLDLCGYNYKWERYQPDHEREPQRVIAGTESFPVKTFETLMATADNSWVIGDFVWTSLDYLGETALGHTQYDGEESEYAKWPWTAANCGDLDLCGFPRPQNCYRQIIRGTGPKVACFVQTPLPEGKSSETVFGWGWPNEWPSWNWEGHEGETLTVRAYSACPSVRLLLNGQDLGARDTNRGTRFTAEWQVPYQPGELEAVALDEGGAVVERWTLTTAGEPAEIRLTADAALASEGQDLSFVVVEVVDANGVLCPSAEDLIHFEIEGPATLVAVANSNPKSTESFQQPQRKAWRGRALAIVRAGTTAGEVKLVASSEGLTPAEVMITVG
ncbi:MAG: sugar-binding domain-containing protein [Armatimonadota bacterium]